MSITHDDNNNNNIKSVSMIKKSKLINPYYGGYRCRIISDHNDNDEGVNDVYYILLQNSRTINLMAREDGEKYFEKFLINHNQKFNDNNKNNYRINRIETYPNPLKNELKNLSDVCMVNFHCNNDNNNDGDVDNDDISDDKIFKALVDHQKHQQSMITLENVSSFDLQSSKNINNDGNGQILLIKNENYLKQQMKSSELPKNDQIKTLLTTSSMTICSFENSLINRKNNDDNDGKKQRKRRQWMTGYRRQMKIDLDTTKFFQFL